MYSGSMSILGGFKLKVTRHPSLWWKIKQAFRYSWKEFPLYILILILPVLRFVIPGLTVVHSKLSLKIIKCNGEIIDLGIIGKHLVTTAGKNFVAACFDNTSEPEVLKYHGFGTGTNAAVIGDTTLQTELTTAYAVDNTRPTGSQAHATNTYTTVATITPDAVVALTEWGLLSQAATGGGTLFDRQVFSAINLNGSGDSLQATYVLTIS